MPYQNIYLECKKTLFNFYYTKNRRKYEKERKAKRSIFRNKKVDS